MPEWRDDPTINDDEHLWRRVLVDDPFQVKKDPKTGQPRPSSAAFKSSTQLTSVAVASLTTPEEFLAGFSRHSLVEVNARAVRDAGCILVRDPEPGNPAHAHIIGITREDGRLTSSEARRIADKARWVVYKSP